MTTHNIEEGLDRSDRVGILAGGRIVYESGREGVDRETFREIYISRVENA